LENFGIEILNGKREPLARRLPLKMPLSVTVTTANACNLRCEYCAVSDKNHRSNKAFIDMDTFALIIDRMVNANWHLKQIIFVGLGEPLLNKNIVNFVRMAKDAHIADSVQIVSNGTLLTHELSDRLLDAGLDVLRISLNGLCEDDFKKYAGRSVDVGEMVNNLQYFFEKKETAKVYVKIMDYMVNTDEKMLRFKKLFAPVSDVINVEYMTEMSPTMDYAAVAEQNRSRGLKGFAVEQTTEICPLPFYHTYINAEGTISACCVAGPWYTPPALVMGDLRSESIDSIWNGKNFTEFWIRMLRGGKNMADPVCKACKAYMSYIYPEDFIDSDAGRIANELEARHV